MINLAARLPRWRRCSRGLGRGGGWIKAVDEALQVGAKRRNERPRNLSTNPQRCPCSRRLQRLLRFDGELHPKRRACVSQTRLVEANHAPTIATPSPVAKRV